MSYPRKKVRKKGVVWYWRFQIPVTDSETGEYVKDARGKQQWRWIERGTDACAEAECKRLGPEIESEARKEIEEGTKEAPAEKTFGEVATLYMKSKGEGSGRFLDPILARIENKPCSKITQELVQKLADEIYPGCVPSTINRQLFTPINAVLKYGSELRPKMCDEPSLKRPKGHTSNAIPEVPRDDWYMAVMPFLSAKRRAALLFMRLHGARIGEALCRTPGDLDTRTWTLTIPASEKGNPPRHIKLSKPVIETIQAIPDWQNQKWLFGTRWKSNFYRDVMKACNKAGVPYYSSHPAGRHSFSTGYLNDGRSLKELQEAVGWQSLKMPGKYAHLEKSAVQRSVNESADRWFSNLTSENP